MSARDAGRTTPTHCGSRQDRRPAAARCCVQAPTPLLARAPIAHPDPLPRACGGWARRCTSVRARGMATTRRRRCRRS
eukprot:6230596-Prymnesium_polylepis.1